jgi:hypothetical protein
MHMHARGASGALTACLSFRSDAAAATDIVLSESGKAWHVMDVAKCPHGFACLAAYSIGIQQSGGQISGSLLIKARQDAASLLRLHA